jgi:hypothetical protein
MVYVVQVCRQLSSTTRLELLESAKEFVMKHDHMNVKEKETTVI